MINHQLLSRLFGIKLKSSLIYRIENSFLKILKKPNTQFYLCVESKLEQKPFSLFFKLNHPTFYTYIQPYLLTNVV
jgi:hypothetical protein